MEAKLASDVVGWRYKNRENLQWRDEKTDLKQSSSISLFFVCLGNFCSRVLNPEEPSSDYPICCLIVFHTRVLDL